MLFLGIIEENFRVVNDIPGRINYTKRIIRWNLLKDLVNPSELINQTYGWGSDQLKFELLMNRLKQFLNVVGVKAYLAYPSEQLLNDYYDPDNPDLSNVQELRIPILGGTDDPVDPFDFELLLSLIPIPPEAQRTSRPDGLAIGPSIIGSFQPDESLPLEVKLKGGFELDQGIKLEVHPQKVDIHLADPATGAINSELSLASKSGEEPIIIIGSELSHNISIFDFGIKLGVKGQPNNLDAYVSLDIRKAEVTIDTSNSDDADSFLSSLLPPDGLSTQFTLQLGFSTRQGLYFGGSSGLEVSLPAHVDVGLIEIVSSTIAIKTNSGAIPIEVGATIKGELGPLTAIVENMGFRARFTFPSDSSGNLGPVDLNLGFKPPSGIGLSIDAGVVKGGGYLYLDIEKEEYAGALELVVSDFLTLKAIGLITTRMPDGSRGFSLLVIITAEFGSPIQLGFGFTLSGVGGLLGLHRTMRLQPLSEGVRTGAVNSIMFPTNVIENAPRIISDLRTYFPPFQDIFLIGPMAKIGWGTPNLVKLSLGIIIEIPGNIAILGVLKVTLPDEEKKLLNLQVNFIGAIEPDKKQAWFFASMFDSRVLSFTIEGEMGVLVCWGDNANFVVSVGGFHPAFNPPPLPFPEPRRIAISILNTELARIRVEGYFAVTSNTVQFGARAELYFGLSAFKIDGYVTFDALFQFSPFYFIISISASLSVRVFGVGLFSVRMRGSLEGPTPWHVEGTGSISLLFFDIDVDFSHTWGEEIDTTLPPIDVMPLLKAEYEKLENWKAEVPAANSILVSLRKIETANDLVPASRGYPEN